MLGSPLVIGIDSMIGSVLFQRLTLKGRSPNGTSRRLKKGAISLDLAQEDFSVLPNTISIAYLCVGITRLKTCEEQPVKTRLINVDRTKTLIEEIWNRNGYVVFLSSDLALNTGSEYGRQKREVERFLQLGQGTIVRLSKVLNGESDLLCEWIQRLKKGKDVHAFSDYWFQPIDLGKVIDVLENETLLKKHQLISLTSSPSITYFEAIKFVASKLSYNIGNVHEAYSNKKVEKVVSDEKAAKQLHFDTHVTLTNLYVD